MNNGFNGYLIHFKLRRKKNGKKKIDYILSVNQNFKKTLSKKISNS